MVQRDLHHQLVRGVYQIFNLASGTVVDVSLDDRKSVKGHPAHGMLNQQWEVVPLGSGYSFRSILNGHYLTLEKGAHEGAHIMATPYPISWSVEPFYLERESWVIAWPNAPLVFDLHRGSNKPGETIHLCPRRPVEFCQRWRFVPCQDKFLSDPIDEVMSTPTIEPKEHKKPIRNAVTQREVKDAIPSPTTSTVETIVEPEGLVYVDGGDLKITTIITSVTMLKRYPTKPENGKTYRIINGTGDNVIDLHGIDKISIIGHRAHNGPSQQWTLEQHGLSWALKSVWSGQYIGFNAQPEGGTPLIAVDHPIEWDIVLNDRDKNTYRIFVPGTPVNFDLSNYGKGPPIMLHNKWECKHQTWKLEEV